MQSDGSDAWSGNEKEGQLSLLVDIQINEKLSVETCLATGVPLDDFLLAKSKVQASSLNLTIGDIFIPGPAGVRLGGVLNPLKEIALRQGHTAVMRTAETLNFGPQLAGIAFPPATLSLNGILMTNPGHIDPGYKGPLHITVINMGRKAFPLRAGDRIMRVLFLELAERPSASYSERHKDEKAVDVITAELLDKLSVDFVDVEKRARKVANKAVTKAATLATAIPAIIAAAALLANWYIGLDPIRDSIGKIDSRLSVAESRQTGSLEERIRKIEDTLSAVNPPAKK
jgi:dCTP deaminase